MSRLAEEILADEVLAEEMLPEIISDNQARAVVYDFLSSLFAKELNTNLVSKLTSPKGQNFLSSLANEPTLAPSVSVISKHLTELNSNEALLELAADFCGLFLIDSKTSVSPYAGHYINYDLSKISEMDNKNTNRALFFGELHQIMMGFLKASNIQVRSDFPEPADHIAVLLAYISHLCLKIRPETQLKFIELYLMTWLSDFIGQVKIHDPDCFYTAVAELTFEWVKLDIDA